MEKMSCFGCFSFICIVSLCYIYFRKGDINIAETFWHEKHILMMPFKKEDFDG